MSDKIVEALEKLVQKTPSQNWEVLADFRERGQSVTLWCGVYIYHGDVERVEDGFVVLSNAYVVYGTGDLGDGRKFSEVERINDEWFVNVQFIESFGVMNKKPE